MLIQSLRTNLNMFGQLKKSCILDLYVNFIFGNVKKLHAVSANRSENYMFPGTNVFVDIYSLF